MVIRKPTTPKRTARRKSKPDKPLWEKIVERGKRIPPEELANFPTDGARNLPLSVRVAKQDPD
jgi:hypothetical protein